MKILGRKIFCRWLSAGIAGGVLLGAGALAAGPAPVSAQIPNWQGPGTTYANVVDPQGIFPMPSTRPTDVPLPQFQQQSQLSAALSGLCTSGGIGPAFLDKTCAGAIVQSNVSADSATVSQDCSDGTVICVAGGPISDDVISSGVSPAICPTGGFGAMPRDCTGISGS